MKYLRVQAGLWAAAILVWGGAAHAEMTRASAEQLMRSGKSLKCGVTVSENGGTQKGTVYISNSKMRGDFDVSQPGEGSFTAHMVQDGDWAYTWGGPMGETQGVKMRADRSRGSGHSQTFNADEEMDMDCSEWRPDASKFSLPAGVQFMDLNAAGLAAGPMGGQMPGMQQMQCQACDQMPAGPDQDMCRQMLGCKQ